ncbi:hypothetical protein COMA2_20513 [Candidatus Nitrospira nitrificans]|uniref:Uncharacterized protein n=1 Tax=Candidatus Nitrospira nitrificans TaxID=1742973 RepID=A0A0S4LH60_9BACT|nr:hypothetical protein COMA2_20513 [Candidatus Nitrospira nitrificans]
MFGYLEIRLDLRQDKDAHSELSDSSVLVIHEVGVHYRNSCSNYQHPHLVHGLRFQSSAGSAPEVFRPPLLDRKFRRARGPTDSS